MFRQVIRQLCTSSFAEPSQQGIKLGEKAINYWRVNEFANAAYFQRKYIVFKENRGEENI